MQTYTKYFKYVYFLQEKYKEQAKTFVASLLFLYFCTSNQHFIIMGNKERANFGSRLGIILATAGSAVGLGNVWRFPFVTGKYGGGMFVLLYLLFLLILGFPLLTAELAIGRAGRGNLISSSGRLAGKDSPWPKIMTAAFAGNLLLMMYYTVVTGWLLAYTAAFFDGSIMLAANPGAFFGALVASPGRSTLYMVVAVALSAVVCGAGLRSGVEKTVKVMMVLLFCLIAALAVRSILLPGAAEGLKFYLRPDPAKFTANIGETLYAAMGQAFFTLSIGVGSIAIFGSYTGKSRSLPGEGLTIIALDTLIALLAGMVIFPCCFTYGVDPGAGPGLIFVSLPNTFRAMPGGRWWGGLFFIFLSTAALTTVIAVFENLIDFLMTQGRMKRAAAALTTGIAVAVLALPCVFGNNIWSRIQPLGKGSSILDLEDFIVSQNLLPLGALAMALFCTLRYGWGWEKFIAEANTGEGMKIHPGLKWYFKYVLPVLICVVMAVGYFQIFK